MLSGLNDGADGASDKRGAVTRSQKAFQGQDAATDRRSRAPTFGDIPRTNRECLSAAEFPARDRANPDLREYFANADARQLRGADGDALSKEIDQTYRMLADVRGLDAPRFGNFHDGGPAISKLIRNEIGAQITKALQRQPTAEDCVGKKNREFAEMNTHLVGDVITRLLDHNQDYVAFLGIPAIAATLQALPDRHSFEIPRLTLNSVAVTGSVDLHRSFGIQAVDITFESSQRTAAGMYEAAVLKLHGEASGKWGAEISVKIEF